MRLLIKEFAAICGTTVRTLHYYDEIGLLKPAFVDDGNGYRWYDERSFERMQEIMFFRELGFSLKNILEILSSPDYDRIEAFRKQKELMIIKKMRIEKLIAALEAAETGGKITDMSVFDNNSYESLRQEYAAEAEARWGGTQAYREYNSKTKNYSQSQWSEAGSGMELIFSKFADLMKLGCLPGDADALSIAAELQAFITEHFYQCTDEILYGLGEMYCADERFRKNIDKWGEGTAEFAAESIRCFVASSR